MSEISVVPPGRVIGAGMETGVKIIMGQYDEYNSVQSCIVVIFLELFCLIYDKYLACEDH